MVVLEQNSLTDHKLWGTNACAAGDRLPKELAYGPTGRNLIHPQECTVAEIPAYLESPADAVGTWWVARVKHHQESALVLFLEAGGASWCLPQCEQETKYAKRKYLRRVPLFRDYVPFCCQFPGDELGVLQLRPVCDLIRVVRQKLFVRQLSQVYHVNKLHPLDPYPHAVVGKLVQIASGTLQGTQGVVEQRNGKNILVLRVDMLGQSVAMDVDIANVEAAEELAA